MTSVDAYVGEASLPGNKKQAPGNGSRLAVRNACDDATPDEAQLLSTFFFWYCTTPGKSDPWRRIAPAKSELLATHGSWERIVLEKAYLWRGITVDKTELIAKHTD